MTDTALALQDVVDLEARMALDADADPARLRERDRDIHARIAAGPGAPPATRAALLRAWLDALRVAQGGSLGERVARAWRLIGAALVLLGLVTGWGVAAWVLQYDGRTPVDVAGALLALVGPQLLLLVLMPAFLLLRRWSDATGRVPLLGDLREVLGWLAGRLTSGLRRAGEGVDGDRRAHWRHAWHRVRSRRSLYRPVEQWTVFGLLQGFGVAFNVAALLCCLQRVVFSDLAFAWSTTLGIGTDTFHGIVGALAAPWSWLWSEAAPSAELVAATRYSRLEAAYSGAVGARAVDPTLVGGWWRFLVAALSTYGLVPRAALLLLSRRQLARALRRLPLDNPDVDRVVRRLTAGQVEIRPVGPEPPGLAPPPAPVAPAATEPGDRCAVVLWRGVPRVETALVRAARLRFGSAPALVAVVDGYAAEQHARDRLRAHPGPVLVIAEAREAPDKAARRLLRDLRGTLGPSRALVVSLVGEVTADGWAPPAAEDVRLWREELAVLEDPWLGVEPLEDTP